MKKVLFTLILTAFAGISMAQEQKATKGEKQTQTTEENADTWKSYGGEWFFGVGAGAQYYVGDHNRQAKIKDILTPTINANVGRWFTPLWGLRIGYQGYKLKGLSNPHHHHDNTASMGVGETGYVLPEGEHYYGFTGKINPYGTGVEYKGNEDGLLERTEMNFMNLHADMLFNLTQWIYGKGVEKRFNVIPYIGVGWTYIYTKPIGDSFTFGGGIQTTCKLADHLNLVLDLHSLIMQDKIDIERGGRHGEGIVDASLGLNYHF